MSADGEHPHLYNKRGRSLVISLVISLTRCSSVLRGPHWSAGVSTSFMQSDRIETVVNLTAEQDLKSKRLHNLKDGKAQLINMTAFFRESFCDHKPFFLKRKRTSNLAGVLFPGAFTTISTMGVK